MKNENETKCLDVSIINFEDILFARQKVKQFMEEMGFPILARTRIVTAVSELARNIIVHSGKGTMITYRLTSRKAGKGIKCVFKDNGHGIENLQEAMKEGFSTVNSLGLGLSGSKKLCSEFFIDSVIGKGTEVTIIEWLK